MQLPDHVRETLQAFDRRSDIFSPHDVASAIRRSTPDGLFDPAHRHAEWAEWSAFCFYTNEAPHSEPWGKYFRPWRMAQPGAENTRHDPDIADATAETINHWAERAFAAAHPVLAARYADLVWEFSKTVTGKAADIKYAHKAIDSYTLLLSIDTGNYWLESRIGTNRLLRLSRGIHDMDRLRTGADQLLSYAERAKADGRLGVYCNVFQLLALESGALPPIAHHQHSLASGLETEFRSLTEKSELHDPHTVRQLGDLLAKYYQRSNRHNDAKELLIAIARSEERHSQTGDGLFKLYFLNSARRYFAHAGESREAERVMRSLEDLAPELREAMSEYSLTSTIPRDKVEPFLANIVKDGPDCGLVKWACYYIPRQEAVRKWSDDLDRQFASRKIFSTMLVNDEGIISVPDDRRGDPDGPMVHATKEMISFTMLLPVVLKHLAKHGADADRIIQFISQSPVFDRSRLSILRIGLQHHFREEYLQAAHVLIPQIERALVELIYKTGGTSKKSHQSGRGAMQSKSLNDALDDSGVRTALGEDLRMYLVTILCHPKGFNLRNLLCHGILDYDAFNIEMSARIVHVLVSLSLVGQQPHNPADDGK